MPKMKIITFLGHDGGKKYQTEVLASLKKGAERALIILVSSIAMLKKYAILSKENEINLHKYFAKSRPTTVI